MAQGTGPADSVDFRTPQVNLTAMADDEYAALYSEVAARLESYNQSRVQLRTPVNWIEASDR